MRIGVRAWALFALVLQCASAASVLAIDYGTDSVKASLVKPGLPFDVLINRDSKRKTPSLVAIRDGERLLGSAGESLKTRFPSDVFAALKLLVGHTEKHPQTRLHGSLYSNKVSFTTLQEGGQVTELSTKRGKQPQSYRLEELVANEFAMAKELAEATAGGGERVREAVVSVPAWWSAAERQFVVDALDLAGMSTLAIVNDGAAAAVNYAMSRTFAPEQTNHLFYDFGAGSVRATVVSLKSAMVPDLESLAAKPALKNATVVNVHGYGYDLDVGGFAFDKAIRDLLKAKFESENPGTKLDKNERAMAKLLKEASRVKHVLSANNEAVARVEGLVDELDLRVSITRQEFESQFASSAIKFTQPINDALRTANLTLNDITSVIMVGGSSRVPMVESAVATLVGEEKVAKNVNADEAVVLGSALYGAAVTPGFRTKDIRVQDSTLYGIDASYEADSSNNADAKSAAPRRITTHLFPAFSKLGQKKTMTFKKLADFALRFSYRPTSQPIESSPDLFEVSFKGISKAVANATAEQLTNATVKVTIELDEMNLVHVRRAILSFGDDEVDASAPSLNDRLKGLLGKLGSGTKKTKKAAEDKSSKEDDKDEGSQVKQGEGDDEAEELKRQAEIDDLMRKLNSTVTLTSSRRSYGSRRPLTSEEKSELKKRLREAKAAETRKLAREEARNGLEAFIYRARDLVSSDASFIASSTDAERKQISDKVAAAHAWLNGDGDAGAADEASTKDLRSRKSDIEKLVRHVESRSIEAGYRPALVSQFESFVATTKAWLKEALAENAKESVVELKRWTADELGAFEKATNELKAWFDDLRKKQDALKPFEDAVLKRTDVEKRIRDVEKDLDKLKKKKKPRKVPSKKASSSTSSSSSSSSAESSTTTTTTTSASASPSASEHIKDEL